MSARLACLFGVFATTFGGVPDAAAGADWTPAQVRRGYAVCSRTTLKPFYARHVPGPGQIVEKVGCVLARGEFEPLMIGVHAIAGPLLNVRMAVESDLPVRIYRFLPYRRAEPGKGELDIPWFLLPQDRIARIEAGRTGSFWLVFHASEHAAPGPHTGSIRITADGRPPTLLQLVVRVRPILLPRPNIAFGMYYSLQYFRQEFHGRDYQRQYFQDMAAHGMTTCTIFSLAEFTENTPQRKGLIRYDTWSAVEQLRLMKEAGLIHPDTPVILLDGRVFEARDKAAVAADLQRYCRTNGWPELLLYTRDEPGWQQFAELIPQLTPWKKIPQIRTVTAMNSQPPYALGYLHDVWIVRNDEITGELIREAGRLGADVWTYAIDLAFSNPLANRYYAGLYTWGFRLGGNCPWAYHDRPGAFLTDEGTPSTYTANGYILPSKAGPIPSVGWEGRREGVDDYRYLQLLETVLAATASGNGTAKAARAWLADLRAKIGWNFYGGNTVGNRRQMDFHDPNPRIRVDEYDRIRQKATDYILKLDPVAEKPLPALVHRVPPAIAGKYEPAAFVDRSVAECVKALDNANVADRRAAARALGLRGRQAAPAVSRLIELLQDEDVRFVALRALEAIGPQAEAAIPALTAQLDHPDPFVRLGATFALAGIGPKTLPALEKSIDDEAWYVAVVALQKVGQMGPAAAALVEAIARQLAHPNGDRCTWAAAALRDMGPAAAGVIPELVAAVRDSRSVNARWWSAEALGKLGPVAGDAIPVLQAAADDPNPLMRAEARVALFRITGDQKYLRQVTDRFADQPVYYRRQIAALLRCLGAQAAPTAPQVRDLLKSERDSSARKSLELLLKTVAPSR